MKNAQKNILTDVLGQRKSDGSNTSGLDDQGLNLDIQQVPILMRQLKREIYFWMICFDFVRNEIGPMTLFNPHYIWIWFAAIFCCYCCCLGIQRFKRASSWPLAQVLKEDQSSLHQVPNQLRYLLKFQNPELLILKIASMGIEQNWTNRTSWIEN